MSATPVDRLSVIEDAFSEISGLVDALTLIDEADDDRKKWQGATQTLHAVIQQKLKSAETILRTLHAAGAAAH